MAVRINNLILNLNNRVLSRSLILNCSCPTSLVVLKRDLRKRTSQFPADNAITRMEEMGRRFQEKTPQFPNNEPVHDYGMKVDSTGQIFTSYVPPEKKEFFLTPTGIYQRFTLTKEKFRTIYSNFVIRRQLKQTKETFQPKQFALEAQKKFIDTNRALQKNDKKSEKLMEEHATLMVVRSLKELMENRTQRPYWRFVEQIEKPRVVTSTVGAVEAKDNMFAQVTVRMHTKQILALRDRMNRVVSGDIHQPKSVVDYVVFERHLKDKYGRWRICGKIM